MHFDYRVLSSSGLFGCQREIEILSIYTNFTTIKYSHVHNLIKMRLSENFNLCILMTNRGFVNNYCCKYV